VNTASLAASAAATIPVHEAAAALRPRGVRVHAIGTLRVSFGRLPIDSLAGPKAGTNQALGLFGFLFDRGPRGVDKDEAIEIIWPDVALGVADTAFHRTLLGLRGTLRTGGFGDAVEFRNGRYVLASGLVSWSDMWELERLVTESATARESVESVRLLEECRTLNTADYMDDCPFFGTSVFVEPRRAMLRAVREAVLNELVDQYTASGHLALAAIRQAEARAVSEMAETA
jgi:two-component SAPR family response regulator